MVVLTLCDLAITILTIIKEETGKYLPFISDNESDVAVHSGGNRRLLYAEDITEVHDPTAIPDFGGINFEK